MNEQNKNPADPSAPALSVVAGSPLGILMEARLEVDGFPMVMVTHSRMERREDAMAYALKYMREDFKQTLLFVRLDGFHEAWGRGQLEQWANVRGETRATIGRRFSSSDNAPSSGSPMLEFAGPVSALSLPSGWALSSFG